MSKKKKIDPLNSIEEKKNHRNVKQPSWPSITKKKKLCTTQTSMVQSMAPFSMKLLLFLFVGTFFREEIMFLHLFMKMCIEMVISIHLYSVSRGWKPCANSYGLGHLHILSSVEDFLKHFFYHSVSPSMYSVLICFYCNNQVYRRIIEFIFF